jgi:hypothetical protein
MQQRISASLPGIVELQEIVGRIEKRVRSAHLRYAMRYKMNKRIITGASHVRILLEIICGIEEWMGSKEIQIISPFWLYL